jgi:hypothetical protein
MSNNPYPSERLEAIETRLARIEVALGSIARERAAGSVYIVADGQGRYKIGKSTDTEGRVKSITTSNIGASLVLTIETDNRHALERELHRVYRKAGRHLGGEWYALAQEDIDTLAALPSPLFEDELGRVKAIRCGHLDTAQAEPRSNGTHPNSTSAATLARTTQDAHIIDLLLSGAGVNDVLRDVKGIDPARGGRKVQEARAEIEAVIRANLSARAVGDEL